jgi:hypothetical protein
LFGLCVSVCYNAMTNCAIRLASSKPPICALLASTTTPCSSSCRFHPSHPSPSPAARVSPTTRSRPLSNSGPTSSTPTYAGAPSHHRASPSLQRTSRFYKASTSEGARCDLNAAQDGISRSDVPSNSIHSQNLTEMIIPLLFPDLGVSNGRG